MLIESGDLIPVLPESVEIPWTRRKTLILNCLHRGRVNFQTFVYDTNVGDIAPLSTYFNPDRWTEQDLNQKFGIPCAESDLNVGSAASPILLNNTAPLTSVTNVLESNPLLSSKVKSASIQPRLLLIPERDPQDRPQGTPEGETAEGTSLQRKRAGSRNPSSSSTSDQVGDTRKRPHQPALGRRPLPPLMGGGAFKSLRGLPLKLDKEEPAPPGCEGWSSKEDDVSKKLTKYLKEFPRLSSSTRDPLEPQSQAHYDQNWAENVPPKKQRFEPLHKVHGPEGASPSSRTVSKGRAQSKGWQGEGPDNTWRHSNTTRSQFGVIPQGHDEVNPEKKDIFENEVPCEGPEEAHQQSSLLLSLRPWGGGDPRKQRSSSSPDFLEWRDHQDPKTPSPNPIEPPWKGRLFSLGGAPTSTSENPSSPISSSSHWASSSMSKMTISPADEDPVSKGHPLLMLPPTPTLLDLGDPFSSVFDPVVEPQEKTPSLMVRRGCPCPSLESTAAIWGSTGSSLATPASVDLGGPPPFSASTWTPSPRFLEARSSHHQPPLSAPVPGSKLLNKGLQAQYSAGVGTGVFRFPPSSTFLERDADRDPNQILVSSIRKIVQNAPDTLVSGAGEGWDSLSNHFRF